MKTLLNCLVPGFIIFAIVSSDISAETLSVHGLRTCSIDRGEKIPSDRLVDETKKGNPVAYNQVGVMYYLGEGLPQDYKLALAAFHKAGVDGNYAPAQFNFALMKYKGQGTEQCNVTAGLWLVRAAENGHKEARKALGMTK